MIVVETLKELAAHVGGDLGVSDWVSIDQKQIDDFAEVTGDRNWYHVDVERARRELPGGKTIVHGLLTLSLIPGMASQIVQVSNHGRALNYGLNRVRFPAPVPVDSRLRLHMAINSAEIVDGGATLIARAYTMELEGAAKPAAVAEMLTLVYP